MNSGAGAFGIRPGLAFQQRFDRLFQDVSGFRDAETLVLAQPVPAFEAQQQIERLDQNGVAGDILGKDSQQDIPEPFHEPRMRLLQKRGTMAVKLSGEQERFHLLKTHRAPIDELKDLLIPAGRLERPLHHRFHRRRDAAGHLAIQRVHIAEMTEYGPSSDLGGIGDLIGAWRQIALGHQLEHGIDDQHLALLRAMLSAIRLARRPGCAQPVL